jgi:hypothetical protein
LTSFAPLGLFRRARRRARIADGDGGQAQSDVGCVTPERVEKQKRESRKDKTDEAENAEKDTHRQ